MESFQNNITPELIKALSDFQADCPPLDYDKTVDYTANGRRVFYKFTSYEHMLKTIRPYLQKHGLTFTQVLNHDTSVTTVLMHTSGGLLAGTLRVPIPDNASAQLVGSNISYNKRYSLASILGIAADDDEGGNAPNPVERRTPAPTATTVTPAPAVKTPQKVTAPPAVEKAKASNNGPGPAPRSPEPAKPAQTVDPAPDAKPKTVGRPTISDDELKALAAACSSEEELRATYQNAMKTYNVAQEQVTIFSLRKKELLGQ